MEGDNWSDAVEDLVDAGDVDGAVALLESLLVKFETQDSDHLQLAYVLSDLANLYSLKGFSLKADEALSRASLLKQRAVRLLSYQPPPCSGIDAVKDSEYPVTPAKDVPMKDSMENQALSPNGSLPFDTLVHDASSEDDWEAIADRAPNELLSPVSCPAISTLSLEDTKAQTPKRRGRGTFSYQKQDLYSDRHSDVSTVDDARNEATSHNSEENTEDRHLRYGTRHVLVLANFPPSTRTTELEKLFENFKDHGVVIRWVNDTVALAVFRTPSIALEACNCTHCSFAVRVLDENDTLLNSIRTRDLEPPRQRPQTSARTAERMIAQAMGMKLPSTSFGSRELRRQEEARKQRIVAKKSLRDDAWGSEDG